MSQNAPYCPSCYNAGRGTYYLVPTGKLRDDQGYRCTGYLCPGCSGTGMARDVVSKPPCKNCGHAESTYVRDGVDDPHRPGAGAMTDGNAFLQMMKGQSIPGGEGR